MKWYTQYVFPLIMDRVLDRPEVRALRQDVLSIVQGRILEIGFGTGLNLLAYPEQVKKITAVDVYSSMRFFQKERIKKSGKEVVYTMAPAEKLPFDDKMFDVVVSTWTLCSVCDVDETLHEVYRVLAPEGKFVFLEHGLADKEKTRAWQKRLNPLWQKIACGCHLDRDFEKIFSHHVFSKKEIIKKLRPTGWPKFMGDIYKGVLVK